MKRKVKTETYEAKIWIGVDRQKKLYARTAASGKVLCRDFCKGYRAKLTPMKATISIDIPKGR